MVFHTVNCSRIHSSCALHTHKKYTSHNCSRWQSLVYDLTLFLQHCTAFKLIRILLWLAMSKYDQFINHPSYTSKVHVYLQQYACIVAEASVLCSNPKQAVCLGENLYFQRGLADSVPTVNFTYTWRGWNVCSSRDTSNRCAVAILILADTACYISWMFYR